MDNRRHLFNAIQGRLEILLKSFPNHSIITKAYDHARSLLSDFSKDKCILLADELTALQTERKWSGTGDDQKCLEELRLVSQSLNNDQHKDVNFVIDLPDSTHKIPQITRHDLPLELLDRINEAYLLHTVAMQPSRILPPGKSILSVLSSRSRPESAAPKDLRQQVSNIMLKAFWDEVLLKLFTIIC